MGKQRRLCTLSHGSMLIKVGSSGERVKGETPSVWRAANLDAAAAIVTRDKESCNRRGVNWRSTPDWVVGVLAPDVHDTS